ncbi:leucyl aminopeptidase [Pelagibius litoralis]|uniref:Probable cytosol aminopeptidase n=1 Tax=Pelagibius litoralis TaxID=374515 RepID=A0A967KGE7_9PROT|nr:leucyl aminopeptidase [Pelagibius litoralis]NIA70291.1 leucyl aminopeptidase [Pelagibius litoralis]
MNISFAAPSVPTSGALVVGVLEGGKLTPSAASLNKTTGGALDRAIKASAFSGKRGELLDIVAPAGVENSRILLVGMGTPAKLSPKDLQDIGGAFAGHLLRVREVKAAVLMDNLRGGKTAAERAANAGFGALLRSYRFDKYKTKDKPEKKPKLKEIKFHLGEAAAARRGFQRLEKVAEGVFLTRDLVSEPANILFPKSLVAEAKKLTKLGVKVQALGEKEMAKLGMGSLLGVAQGSAQEPQMLVMTWQGAPSAKDKAPLAFVGKGVTFDTGGISLKPAAGMEDMKWDMGGAGTVVGLMKALAGRKAKVNAVGVCGLVENMPSSTAQRPGDVVTSMSGQTIEVLNTDAEGRLVLADALWYTQEKFKPKLIVDLATLTGAIIIALGNENAGLFSNDDKLSGQLSSAGEEVGELVWRLPLSAEYDKLIDCEIADMKNISGGRAGGSITAAQFLQRFIKNGTPWAHLDIAGVAWSSKEKATIPKGGTGYGVRLLDAFVSKNYEN